MIRIGSHVGMSGKEMLLGSAKEAAGYGANTFMVYTGAPQNTKRRPLEELQIGPAWEYMKEQGIEDIVIHAPYLINLGNAQKKETFEMSVDFLRLEMERSKAMGSQVLVLHPGAHVGLGAETGIRQIIRGINEVLTPESGLFLALETMAGKGSEIGRSFEELAEIYEGVRYNDRLRVCFDLCHVNDSGYGIREDYDGVMEQFDRILGIEQIRVMHVNDSKNPRGSAKDRHANIGYGTIGFDAIRRAVTDPGLEAVPKILETPYYPDPVSEKKKLPPYREEIAMLREGKFRENWQSA